MMNLQKIDYTKVNWISVLLGIWQLPQIIGALFLLIFLHSDIQPYKNTYNGITVWKVEHSFRTCWSLGPFIFTARKQKDDLFRHESGHSVQSIFLGPLFLFVVGIPSAILLGIKRNKGKDRDWYYAHYPENWANKLGGVEQ